MLAQLNETYYYYHGDNHPFNNHPYKVVGFCKMKEDGVWVDAVIYEDVRHERYVKTNLEFCTKFFQKLP